MRRIISLVRHSPLALVVAAAGVVLIVIGVQGGEAQVVFRKASQVCMECIGLG
ncbi:MAG: CD1871A family CXXC motif-containing protein [Atopobiaceae bacterium]|jgi:hypothetical protein|nr:hypothetical protein [Atopobiaceae bacterium]MCH4179787.1 hypothetical protein [Atopobiaceae bacterium]MCH4213539.1 hypothetical protein [Atopobiaceae bacterium]MCH4229651.1 hypothetical protein [Atopobiaceae bacterium]MCH4276187.1 hypothetical protein [Atopobiaceae bacterium]